MLGKLEKICQTRQEEEGGGDGPDLERTRTTREWSVTEFENGMEFESCGEYKVKYIKIHFRLH